MMVALAGKGASACDWRMLADLPGLPCAGGSDQEAAMPVCAAAASAAAEQHDGEQAGDLLPAAPGQQGDAPLPPARGGGIPAGRCDAAMLSTRGCPT
jgi:hypothetical protein